ncbi:MAG: 2OG-Fe(II) oxygenase [Hyphomonadaceae bacterium]
MEFLRPENAPARNAGGEQGPSDAAGGAPDAASARHAPRYFNHLVIDGFLPGDLREALLLYALDNCEAFVPTSVSRHRYADHAADAETRRSWYCPYGLGDLTSPFKEAVRSGLLPKTRSLGIPEFTISSLEYELVAHRDGSFFRRHIDTATQSARDSMKSDRVVTAVYYFHDMPKQFTGGELALAPLGQGAPKLIEPANNRLVAFPSFVPHEVLPVVCPVNDFSHARFAVNIWLHRARRAA